MTTKEQDSYRDPYAFVNEVSYSKELFVYLKWIFPEVKRKYQPYTRVSDSRLKRNYDGKKKASVIVCPYQECREYCIETEETTSVQNFSIHLKEAHNLTPSEEYVQKLGNTISYIRSNKKMQYTGPFLHVDYENLLLNLENQQ